MSLLPLGCPLDFPCPMESIFSIGCRPACLSTSHAFHCPCLRHLLTPARSSLLPGPWGLCLGFRRPAPLSPVRGGCRVNTAGLPALTGQRPRYYAGIVEIIVPFQKPERRQTAYLMLPQGRCHHSFIHSCHRHLFGTSWYQRLCLLLGM